MLAAVLAVGFGSTGVLIYRSLYGNLHGLRIWIGFAVFQVLCVVYFLLLPRRGRGH